MREYLEVLLLFILMAVLCAGAYAAAADAGTGHTTTPDCYTELMAGFAPMRSR